MFQEADAGALNPKPQTLNLKPQTLNPKPYSDPYKYAVSARRLRRKEKQTTALHKAYYKGSQKGFMRVTKRDL